MKEVQGTRGRRMKVTPVDREAKIPLEVDGETPGHLPASFELLPGALTRTRVMSFFFDGIRPRWRSYPQRR